MTSIVLEQKFRKKNFSMAQRRGLEWLRNNNVQLSRSRYISLEITFFYKDQFHTRQFEYFYVHWKNLWLMH